MLFQKLLSKATLPTSPIQYVGGYVQGFSGQTTDRIITLTSLTGGLASAPAGGDIVIVYFGTGSVVDRNLVVSGYTEIAELYRGDTYDTNLVAAYKFMGSNPDTSFTLTGGTLNIDDAGAIAVQVWRGVDETTPLDVTRTTDTGIDTVLCDPPAITPITSGAIIVAGGAGAHAGGTQTYSSPDLSGFISVGGNDVVDVTIGLGYTIWTSGTFDFAPFTFSGTDTVASTWASVTLALRPA